MATRVQILLLLLASLLSGCGGTDHTAELTGTITIAGSDTLYPILQAAATEFHHQRPRVLVEVSAGGSSSGLTQVSQHAIDLGASDVLALSSMYAGVDLIDHRIAVLPYSVLINPGVALTSVNREQLRDIFTGKITNWSAVGGKDLPIVVVNHPALTDTRANFKRVLLEGSDEVKGVAILSESTPALIATVADTTGAVGYIPTALGNDTAVKPLAINGTLPSSDKIVTGVYPLWSYEHLYTNGQPSPLVGAFLNFMYSGQAQGTFFTPAGLIPITQMRVQQ